MNDRCATDSEAMKEYATNVGRERPDVEWILTDYDTHDRNPYYRGAPGPHPDDYCEDEGEEHHV